MPADPLLAVEGLTVRLAGTPEPLIDGVDFAVAAGETLCIVGESGCGKSMTALAVMGLLPPRVAEVTAGACRFEGRDLVSLPPAALRDLRGNRIAMIFQEPMTALNPAFTIGAQIVETIRRHRGLDARAAAERATEMLARVGIPSPADRMRAYPHQLSGGMRQRVMIAMALANDPALIIADEPTTALDVTIQAQVLGLMRDLQRESGTALVLITHDLGVVAEMADRIAVMYAGRVVEEGTAATVFADPQHPYTLGLMGSVPSLGPRAPGERLQTIPGSVPPPSAFPQGCRFRDRCAFAIGRCAERPPLRRVGAEGRVACHRAPLETLAELELSA